MKSIESTLIIGLMFFISLTSISLLVEDLGNSNINFDEESVKIMGNMTDNYVSLKGNSSYQILDSTGLPTYDEVDAEAREAAESKGVVTRLTGLWDIFTVFPSLLLTSLPFIDDTAAEYITLLLSTILGVVVIYNLIGLYKAWKTGNTGN